MVSTATIVEPCGEKKSKRRRTCYKFKVTSESEINDFCVTWFSKNELIVHTKETSRPDVDVYKYKMLCLGCFRKDSNFFTELKKAGVEVDAKSSNLKLCFTIDLKEYEFYRVTDDGAQVNLKDLRRKPKKGSKNH